MGSPRAFRRTAGLLILLFLFAVGLCAVATTGAAWAGGPAPAPKPRAGAEGPALVLDASGTAHELSRRETADGIEIRISIDVPEASVPAGAEARASFRFEAEPAGAGAEEESGERAGEGASAGGGVPRVRVHVTDASGRTLAARVKAFEDASGAGIMLVVESEGAAFPLTAVLRLALAVEAPGKIATPVPSGDVTPATSGDAAPATAGDAPFVAPPNDDCTGAITIPNGQLQVLTAPVDVIDASVVVDPLFCVIADRSIWYLYTAPVTGTYTITTCAAAGAIGTTMPDTALTILGTGGGCAAPGAGVACNDDDPTCSGGKQSTIVTTLTGGQSYYIIAARYAGVGQTPVAAGATSIQILIARGNANDTCAGTIPSLALDVPVNGTTLTASNDYQLSTGVPNGYQLPGPPLPVGQTLSAAAGRDTVYSFTAPASGAYSFRVTGYSPLQNAVLYVSSECPVGAPPVSVGAPPCVGAANRTMSGGTAEEVMCVPMSAGQTDYVIVDDGGATNVGSAFRLEVNACVREDEPNNTPATANPLACPVQGSMNPVNNADFYVLGTPPAGSRIFAISDGVAANNNDQILRATTAVDTLEFDDDDNTALFGSLSPNLAGTPLTGVASYLRINPLSTSVTEEPYRLYAVVQPPIGSAAVETEPNDTLATANASGANYFSGSLPAPSPSTDLDVFRFTARAGTLVMLNLDGDPLRNNTPIDPKLELLDAASNVLVSVNNSPGSTSSTTSGAGSLVSMTPFSPGEALTYRTPATGTYYARVSIGTTSATAIGAGDYLLSIALDCAAGDLDADGVADAKDCAASDPATWRLATEARNLTVTGKSPTTLNWAAPTDPGTSAPILYDALRATSAAGFGAGTCLASDITGTSATDSGAAPAAGSAAYYLVRSQNACGGNLGTTSSGAPRAGRSCP